MTKKRGLILMKAENLYIKIIPLPTLEETTNCIYLQAFISFIIQLKTKIF